jgi:N-acetyl-beta-hexosaminidase
MSMGTPLTWARRVIPLAVGAAIGVLSASAHAAGARPAAWSLLPAPVIAHPAGTGAIEIATGATVAIRGADPAAAKALLHNFIQRVADVRGLQLREPGGGDTSATITFDVRPDAKVEGDEGYAITVGKAGIVVSARTVRGAFNGSVTVWQLLTQPGWRKGTAARIAYGTIEDHPRFAWRALLLDSSRHYQSAGEIKQLIDWMSLDKLNVLVWHITDDQGWRLPVPNYPELTTTGACREAIGNDADVSGGRDKPYCKAYTAAEISDIVRYAAERNVEIVPEIDLPGHSQAAIATYPWLGVTGKRPAVWTDWGVSPWLLNPNTKTLGFVNDVMDEVMRLFPSHYVSYGGDEADKQQWNASPDVQAQMKALKLANMDELQGWFMQQVANYLVAHGRTPVGWDDEVDAGVALPREQLVMSWHGDHDERVALAALRQGHDVVMTPQESLYFDHLQSERPDEWAGPPPTVTLRQAYDTQLIPPGASATEATHVVGVQAGLWAEQLLTFRHIQHAAYPRVAALAELGWSAPATHDWHGFMARLPAELERYRALGIGYADTAMAPDAMPSPNAAPLIRDSAALKTCSGEQPSRLQGARPASGASPVYAVEIGNACWMWPNANLAGSTHVSVTAEQLPWRYGDESRGAVARGRHGASDAVEIHANTCNGALLATLPLGADAQAGGQVRREAVLSTPMAQDTHALCITATGDPRKGQWALGQISFSR